MKQRIDVCYQEIGHAVKRNKVLMFFYFCWIWYEYSNGISIIAIKWFKREKRRSW